MTEAANTIDATLDATGQTCPYPLLQARRALAHMERGQVLRLISDCTGTDADLRAWSGQTHNPLLRTHALGGTRRAYDLRKGEPFAVSRVVDARGTRCPVPVVNAARALSGLPVGAVVKLVSDCQGAAADVHAWSRSTGHLLLAADLSDPAALTFYLRR